MSAAVLIGVDWGTSNFRAFMLDVRGKILDRRSSADGILSVFDGKFAEVLSAQIGGWLKENRLPVLMSGMIGSRQGWVEASYATTPTSLADLGAALAPVPFDAADVRIVPGLRTETAGRSDVIRGEEVQVFGALARLGLTNGRFVLPGTHSKWVRVDGGRIVSFVTYMTGEIFAATRDHTILGRLMEAGKESKSAFLKGVTDGARTGEPGALLSRLFAVRTAGLFGAMQPDELLDFLSGILIGAEIADAAVKDTGRLGIIGSEALAARYRTAANALGIAGGVVASDCIADGYLALAKIAGLIGAKKG